jgi:hypothetical protein
MAIVKRNSDQLVLGPKRTSRIYGALRKRGVTLKNGLIFGIEVPRSLATLVVATALICVGATAAAGSLYI